MNAIIAELAPFLLNIGSKYLLKFLNPLLRQIVANKYAVIVSAAFKVIDPIVAANFGNISSSDLYQIAKGAITVLGDGSIDGNEVELLTQHVLKTFDIKLALDSTVKPSLTPEAVSANVDTAVSNFKAAQATALQAASAVVNQAVSTSAKDLLGTVPSSAPGFTSR